MTTNSIKLNSANFDYYILRLSPSTKLEQIASKLATLREFDTSSKFLIVEFDATPNFELYSPYWLQINQLVQKYGLQIKFILANKFIQADKIGEIQVINLPETLKSKPIFNQTLIISDPVRSGIKVENDGDIIVTSLVSNNAEIIATGNIHVYGDCRGRVIAGSRGNKSSRIFIARFNAELISIAGIYRALEEKLPPNLYNKAVQIFLDEKDRLNVLPLDV